MAVSDAAGHALGETARGTLARAVLLPSWLALALPAALATLGVPFPPRLRYLPLVASVVLLGLPHGAVDHLALPRVHGERADRAWYARVVAIYAVLGGAYAVAWFLAPVPSAAAFILLTWLHWGQGDLHPLAELVGADHLRSVGQRALAVLVRGGPPMVVPLLAFPERYRVVVVDIVGLFGVAPGAVGWLDAVRLPLGGGLAALTVLSLALGAVRAGDRRAWAVDAGETGLLWWFFLTVPPVLAVGVYFCAWHSLRHVGRLIAVDPGALSALRRGAFPPALARFARDAAPLTVLSLAVLGALAVAVPRSPAGPEGLVALYLVFIAVLTLPHVAVVSLMDREQGLWSGPLL